MKRNNYNSELEDHPIFDGVVVGAVAGIGTAGFELIIRAGLHQIDPSIYYTPFILPVITATLTSCIGGVALMTDHDQDREGNYKPGPVSKNFLGAMYSQTAIIGLMAYLTSLETSF